ncbi:hypothetical protein [Candidatus Protochlamydia sp. R18]|uniref:hypothetical protein n=1 Tax=Candidatus Protochlamydia sp. R18 TaxID=1353977 RepID=UPI00130D9CE4|nr:hypothetical protein [Candidatus Protochlamydia sp. R18]
MGKFRLYCWHCGTKLPEFFRGKLSFRETCDKCGSALHCCQNCKYYQPGRSNNCAIPRTEFVSDRQLNNFCDEFAIQNLLPTSSPNQQSKNKFEDLFNP